MNSNSLDRKYLAVVLDIFVEGCHNLFGKELAMYQRILHLVVDR